MTNYQAKAWAVEISGHVVRYVETAKKVNGMLEESEFAREELLRLLRNAHWQGYRLSVTVNGEDEFDEHSHDQTTITKRF